LERNLTIAACYLSSEGIVLGADSTSTYMTPSGNHYFNHAQKIFEIGEDSTLAIVTWGLGGLSVGSHRTLVALLADDLKKEKPSSVQEVAERWCKHFWKAYSASLKAEIDLCDTLSKMQPFDPAAVPPAPNTRTKAQEAQLRGLTNTLTVGFCIAGYVVADRKPCAYETLFDPVSGEPKPTEIPVGLQRFWGAPNMIARLLHGYDPSLKQAIFSSGNWNGTEAELDNLLKKQTLSHLLAPMRDAIDFTYACISSTIKALKFSSFAQTCGGPIEIAVITCDRPFRWVRHKAWDAAITEGEP
jgi:hypothetical protein